VELVLQFGSEKDIGLLEVAGGNCACGKDVELFTDLIVAAFQLLALLQLLHL
jgi:hypothetical protein